MALSAVARRVHRVLVVGALASLAALAPADPARAQFPTADGPVREVARSSADFTLAGQVTVTFTGPGLEGTTVFRPVPRGQLRAAEFATRSGRRFELNLFGDGSPSGASALTRVVRTAPDGTRSVCTDARADPFPFLSGSPTEPTVAPIGRFTTLPRCPGPVVADLEAAVPTVRLEPASLEAGPRTFDLRGERPLRAGTLTGTVRSSLVLRLDDVSTQRRTRVRRGPSLPRGSTELRVESATGAIGVELAVPGDAPECAELDICGLAGSLSYSPGAVGSDPGSGVISARGRRLYGFIGLTGGAVTARLRRPDGSTCADDSAPAPPAFLELGGGKGERVDVALSGPLGRSRCGEPDLRDLARRPVIARGTTTRTALARGRTTLRLTRGGFDVTGPAGSARLRPDLAVTISRVARR